MCSVDALAEVPSGPGNAARIAAAIAQRTTANGGVVGASSTPTRAALDRATDLLSSLASASPKYVLLATDGAANCASVADPAADDTPGTLAAITRAVSAGFPVFVVGVATAGVMANGVDVSAVLDQMAIAGGFPRAGSPRYYPVASADELASAFRTVVSSSSTCTFQIGPAPSNDGTISVDSIGVLADGVYVPRDTTHANGWDYTDATHNAIAIYGAVCDAIRANKVDRISIAFRCSGIG
jgi:hypothetical protein